MVAPIVSLPARNVILRNFSGIPVYSYAQSSRTVQKAPFTEPTAYDIRIGSCDFTGYAAGHLGNTPFIDATTLFQWKLNIIDLNDLLNKSFEDLKGNVYNTAALGLNFVEAHQALSMITRSATTILGVYRDIKELRFGSAATKLRMHFVPTGVSKHKSAASNFLEYHFGLVPLLSDIHDAIELYREPIKSLEATRGRKSFHDSFNIRTDFQTGGGDFWRRSEYYARDYLAVQGCTVHAITNNNLLSLEQWGVLNPLSLVWEAVPFSFVVDWFVNVGNVLSSFSAFSGMQLTRTYTSWRYRVTTYGDCSWVVNTNQNGLRQSTWTGSGVRLNRTLGLTSPTFSLRPLRFPSPVRAATAISLLIQQLKR